VNTYERPTKKSMPSEFSVLLVELSGELPGARDDSSKSDTRRKARSRKVSLSGKGFDFDDIRWQLDGVNNARKRSKEHVAIKFTKHVPMHNYKIATITYNKC
jgi:hypothetical protein